MMAVNRLSRPTARALQCSYLKSARFLSSSLGKGFTDADVSGAANRATEAKLEERLRAAQAKSGDRWHAFFNIFKGTVDIEQSLRRMRSFDGMKGSIASSCIVLSPWERLRI